MSETPNPKRRKGKAQPDQKPKKAPPAKKRAPRKPKAHEGSEKPQRPAGIADIMAKAKDTARQLAKDKPAEAAAQEAAPTEDQDTDDDGGLCGLSVRAARFIDIFLCTHNATRSYVEAGFKAKNTNVAAASASALLSSAKGRAYLAKRAKAMFERVEGEQDRLMTTLSFAAYADANEIVSHRVGCCRYCWGKAHRYQYTAGEWEQALLKWEEKRARAIEAGKPDPGEMDAKGGTGFLKSREPNTDCPECCGEGEPRIVFKDTEKLSPAALTLYAGTERTKDGIKVNLHSQDKAREMLAKIHRMYDESTKVNVSFDVAKLEAEYGDVMRRAHERSAAIRRERFGEGAPSEPDAGG